MEEELASAIIFAGWGQNCGDVICFDEEHSNRKDKLAAMLKMHDKTKRRKVD